MENVWAIVLIGSRNTNGSPMMKYVWYSLPLGGYEDCSLVFQTEQGANEIGSGLIQLGEKHGQNTFIGIYAVNSVEVWGAIFLSVLNNTSLFLPVDDSSISLSLP